MAKTKLKKPKIKIPHEEEPQQLQHTKYEEEPIAEGKSKYEDEE
jgi:hypothetical protein